MTERALVIVSRVAQRAEDSVTCEMPPSSRKVDPIPSEGWLAYRAQFMERVTAAALRKVKAPLTWVWRVCPERREQAQEIADRIWPDAVLVDTEHTSDAVAPDAQAFVSVRLDADDALAPYALDELARMDLPANAIVDWPWGYKLLWRTGEVAQWEWPRRRQSPFLAITFDGRERMLDVTGPHGRARRGRGRHIRVAERAWLLVVHGQNTTNKWHTGERRAEALSVAKARRTLDRFGVQA